MLSFKITKSNYPVVQKIVPFTIRFPPGCSDESIENTIRKKAKLPKTCELELYDVTDENAAVTITSALPNMDFGLFVNEPRKYFNSNINLL